MSDRTPKRLRRISRRLGRGLLAGLAAAVVVLALRCTSPLRVAESKSYDARVRALADPTAADPDIVIVEIDEGSLELYRDVLGRWPWPRHVYANLLRYLAYGGARLAVFDILVAEPDLDDPASDSTFAAAIAETGSVVLPMTLSRGDTATANRQAAVLRRIGQVDRTAMLRAHALGPASKPPASMSFAYAEPPTPAFGRPAAALGAAHFNPDADGVVRRDLLTYAHDGRLYPSLALAAARAADPAAFGGEVEYDEGELRVGPTRVPLERGRFIIRWRGRFRNEGRTTYRVFAIEQVLKSFEQTLTGREPEVPPDAFDDKIVFVAATAAGLYDLRATPFAPYEPGVMIHATAVDNLLAGDFMRRAPVVANAAAVVGTALLAGAFVAVAGSAIVAGLLTLAALALCTGLNAYLFQQGVWLDLASPLFAGALAFAGTMSLNYVTEGRERKRVRDLFSRYVSPEYVKRLAEDPNALTLGGERVPLTLLFSDIRGFTTLSERLPPETVVGMLNDYLDRMADVVFRHGGTLDKFIGDAVMAFWGAPIAVDDHARRAADAALDMLDELERLNARWRAEGIEAAVDIGIGINTGEAVVGNIGSLSHKLDYTAIGDAVNLASRLEGLNKEYGTHVLVSEDTRAGLGDDYDLRPLDEVRVKGKERSVRIHELSGRRSSPRPAPRAGALAAIAVVLAGAAAPLAAQDATKSRWVDWVYRPGRWEAARLVPFATINEATDTLAVTAMLDGYALPPRWRVEVRRIEDGGALGEPLVLVGEGRSTWVRSGLGIVPLAEHAAANDSLVRSIVARFDAQGRPSRLDRKSVV